MNIKGTADQIADELRGQIEGGVLAPGAALNQVTIAARFGLSRIPVREALRRLEAEGYVTYRPNKGAVISELPPSEVLEILEIRQCLELRLMELAAQQFADEDAVRAARALREMNRARSGSEVIGAHGRFHEELFEAAHRPKMAALVGEWRFALHRASRENVMRKRLYIEATRDVHARLLDACTHNDAGAARAAVREEYDYLRGMIG